jgi:hypothetical protein
MDKPLHRNTPEKQARKASLENRFGRKTWKANPAHLRITINRKTPSCNGHTLPLLVT